MKKYKVIQLLIDGPKVSQVEAIIETDETPERLAMHSHIVRVIEVVEEEKKAKKEDVEKKEEKETEVKK